VLVYNQSVQVPTTLLVG